MVNNHTSLREQNELIVLSEIINVPGISRAEISKNTKVNKATISEIVRKLIEIHLVVETGIGDSSSAGGRKPILLKINKKAGISLTFDIRYDKVSYLASFLDGEVIQLSSKSIQINKKNVVPIIKEIVDKFTQTNSKLKNTPYGLIGITISIHGIISDNKIIFTPYYNLDQINLAEKLNEIFNIPVYIENEANLSALAEASMDTIHNNLISCSIHTGVGAGIIIDEKLYRGFEGRSGEIGHTTLYPNGLKCPCGNYGCLEQYCSQSSLLRFFQEDNNDDSLTLNDLIKSYHNADRSAIKIIVEFSRNLTIGLINLMGSYGPEIIYISSSLISKMPIIVDMINDRLENTIYKTVPIKVSKISNNASLFGANVMNIQKFLNISAIKISKEPNFELMSIE